MAKKVQDAARETVEPSTGELIATLRAWRTEAQERARLTIAERRQLLHGLACGRGDWPAYRESASREAQELLMAADCEALIGDLEVALSAEKRAAKLAPIRAREAAEWARREAEERDPRSFAWAIAELLATERGRRHLDEVTSSANGRPVAKTPIPPTSLSWQSWAGAVLRRGGVGEPALCVNRHAILTPVVG